MKKLSMALVVSLTGLTWADSLTTDKPVYQAGVSGMVAITLTNDTPLTVYIPNAGGWKVLRGNTLVYKPVFKTFPIPLGPGKSKGYEWNKRGLDGKFVPPGSYTIVFGPVESDGGEALTLSRTIALTKTGTIAGKSMFPLSVGTFPLFQGDEWRFSTKSTLFGQPQTMQVTGATVFSGTVWYNVTNLPLGSLVTFEGKNKLTLKMMIPGVAVTDFFRFGQPKGYSYEVKGLGWLFGMKVGGTDLTVVTPAGTFTGCYRLDVIGKPVPAGGNGVFWFAPGIGLVQYSSVWHGAVLYSLQSARIKGIDGKVYTIGIK